MSVWHNGYLICTLVPIFKWQLWNQNNTVLTWSDVLDGVSFKWKNKLKQLFARGRGLHISQRSLKRGTTVFNLFSLNFIILIYWYIYMFKRSSSWYDLRCCKDVKLQQPIFILFLFCFTHKWFRVNLGKANILLILGWGMCVRGGVSMCGKVWFIFLIYASYILCFIYICDV